MKVALFYAVIGLSGAALVASRVAPVPPPAPAPEAAAPEARGDAPAVGNGLAGFVIERAPDNHFYAEAQVNGARLRFMVDTGASIIVLTRADAQRAGIAQGSYSARATGAGGEVRLMPTEIERLALGPLSAANVPAMVAEDGLPVSLLGQSFLARVGSVEIRGDRMILR